MGMALQEQGSPVSFIEYNGYMFGSRTKSRLSITPQQDSSKRTDIWKRYVLSISSFIVPRRNIPGDHQALNIQVEPPGKKVAIPGLVPIHIASTVDAEMKIIIEKLTEPGKTLRYIGQGVSDIVVNTLHPATGKFIQDLNFGPKCRISALEPIGFNKCYKIQWECEFHLNGTDLDLNELHSRILEYNYAVNYRYDSSGYCTRSIQGHIRIVPPMLRSLGTLAPTSTIRNTNDNTAETNAYLNLEDNSIAALEFGTTESKTKIQDIYYSLTAAIKKYKSSCLMNSLEVAVTDTAFNRILIDIYESIGLFILDDDAEKIGNLFFNIYKKMEDVYIEAGSDLSFSQFDKAVKQKDDANEAFIYFRNYFFSGLFKRVPLLRKYPEISKVFPEGTAPLNDKICYGPFTFDNIGNLQNYETVDQYRELVYNSIIIPFNFRREAFEWAIDESKVFLRFSITDKEYPPFSFVPGYSSVQAHQDTSSTGAKFIQFNTSISATFRLGKHVFANPTIDRIKGYADSYKNETRHEQIYNNTKQLPSKRQAYVDFLKLVFQRLAVPLLLNRKGINAVNIGGSSDKKLMVKTNTTCIPHTFQCREDIFSDTITYTLGYKLISDIGSFFVVTGHGLPAIIASDLQITKQVEDFVSEHPDATGEKPVLLEKRRRYVASILFSKYTDVSVHRDWLLSQRYSGNNARGGTDLYFDRTYDRPININVLGEHINRVIPLHGEYPNLKPKRALQEFKFKSLPPVIGLYGSNIIKAEGLEFNEDSKTPRYTKPRYFYQDGNSSKFKYLFFSSTGLFGDSFTSEEIAKPDFLEFKRKQEEAIKLAKPGFYTRYQIYETEEFLRKFESLRGEIENFPKISNTDIDIFYEDLQNNKNPQQQTEYTSILTVPTIEPYSEEQEDDLNQGNSYDSVSDFITQTVSDFITTPSPLNSWLAYECELEINTDNKIIRHKVLPSHEVVANFGEKEIPTDLIINELIRVNQDSVANTGPNSLKGGSPNSDFNDNIASPLDTDIIQVINEPSHVIILKGYAARLNYEVVTPTLLRYGGKSVIQRRRIFTKKAIGEENNKTHYGAWYIEYYVQGHPSGFLGSPKAPWQIENLTVPQQNTSIQQVITLYEKSQLLEEATKLIGFPTLE